MAIRMKPFLATRQRRERIVADDVRRNEAENIDLIINSFSDVAPEERKPLLVTAEALRRLGLILALSWLSPGNLSRVGSRRTFWTMSAPRTSASVDQSGTRARVPFSPTEGVSHASDDR